MIRKLIVVWILSLMSWQTSVSAREIEGVKVPEILNQIDILLLLNGAGAESRYFFFDVYVSALYLQDRSQDAEKIIRDNMAEAVRIHIVSWLFDEDDLIDAILDGLDNATGGNIQPIQSQIERFIEVMNEEVETDDYFDFVYLPESGLNIFKNGTFKAAIKGLNFKRAFFAIWLGVDPVNEDLKEAMLGLQN